MGVLVVKIGGEIIDNEQHFRACVDACVTLVQQTEYSPILVHGGGKQISAMTKRFGIVPQFENGLRITSAQEMSMVQMVLAGDVNSIIVRALQQKQLNAVGLSGVSAGLLRAEPMAEANRTARGALCAPHILRQLLANDYIPVVAPVGVGPNGDDVYNVNADTAAVAVAHALEAELVFLTDVPGVMDANGVRIPRVTVADYQQLVAEGVVTGGMQAKLAACFAKMGLSKKKKAVIGMIGQECDILSLVHSKQGTVVWNETE